MTGVAYLV